MEDEGNIKVMEKNIIISFRTVLLTITLLGSAWLLFQIRGVILLIFVALIFALILDPLVNFLQKKWKWSRFVGVSLIYLVLIAFIIFISTFFIKPLVEQTTNLLLQLPGLLTSLEFLPGVEGFDKKLSSSLLDQLTLSSGDIVKVGLGAFSNIIAIFSVLVFSFYLLLDFDKVKDSFVDFFPEKEQKKLKKLLSDIETKLGSWLRGQLILMLLIGLATFVGLSLLRVKYALPLALLAGFLEIIPMIGPTISAVPAIIVAGTDALWLGLATLLLYILVQQLENNFIVPKVMQKAVGFNPLVTIVALLTGGKLFGVAGALLAIPVLAISVIVVRFLFDLEE